MDIGQTEPPERVWRGLSSRRAYRFFLWCFAVLIISGIALRVEAAIYGRQIISAVSALSTLRVGETSQAQALSRLPRLRASATGPYSDSPCKADGCFFVGAGNGLPGRILWGTRNRALASLLRWWGFRFESLNVWTTFTSGRVSYVSYWLMVSAPGVRQGVPPPPRDGEAGVVVISVSSTGVINSGEPNSTEGQHRTYRVLPARSAPSQSVGITLTPNAPEEIVRDAFDLKLNCLWTFEGCHRWNQLLPGVQPLIRQ
jgi:hypothetical protein